MKLICRWCGKIEERDMRFRHEKNWMSKRGYRSFCDNFKKTTYLQPIKKAVEKRKIHK